MTVLQLIGYAYLLITSTIGAFVIWHWVRAWWSIDAYDQTAIYDYPLDAPQWTLGQMNEAQRAYSAKKQTARPSRPGENLLKGPAAFSGTKQPPD